MSFSRLSMNDQRLLAGLSGPERKSFIDNLEKLITSIEAKTQK